MNGLLGYCQQLFSGHFQGVEKISPSHSTRMVIVWVVEVHAASLHTKVQNINMKNLKIHIKLTFK